MFKVRLILMAVSRLKHDMMGILKVNIHVQVACERRQEKKIFFCEFWSSGEHFNVDTHKYTLAYM